MHHVAIDLGGKESQICKRAPDGQILEEVRYPTAKLATYLKKQPPSRIILETSAEAFKIADAALELGHEVRVVPATLVPSLGVGSRGVKTDRRDAQVLSEVSTRIDLPSVHVPAQISRARKASCTAREALVSARTQLVNSVRGWSRTELLKLGAGKPSTFPSESREGSEPSRRATRIRQPTAARDRSHHRADRPSRRGAQADGNERSGLRASDERPWRRSSDSWSLRISRKLDPLAIWANQVEARRGKKIAVTALARRIAGVLYALWRDGTRYNPTRLNAPSLPAGSD